MENQQIEQDRKLVEEFLSKSENRQMAIELAHQIKKELGDNWFTVKQFIKKFKANTEEVKAKLIVLGAFNLAAYKEENGKQSYKIDLDHKTQRQLLLQELEFHQAQALILKEKLSKLD